MADIAGFFLFKFESAMARKDPRRNLTRVKKVTANGGFVGGWSVRIQRRGVKTARYFGDSVYGGNRKALAAAKEFRDRLEAESSHYSVKELAQTPSVRNQSGVVGVRLHLEKKVLGDYVHHYWFWVAQWIDGHGNRKTRSFSVHQYGDEEAYRLACAARKKGVTLANR